MLSFLIIILLLDKSSILDFNTPLLYSISYNGHRAFGKLITDIITVLFQVLRSFHTSKTYKLLSSKLLT